MQNKFCVLRLIERSPMHERSVSPVEYHDLQTKTLLDLLKNISEEAEDYASSNSSFEKGGDKSPMVHLSRQLKKIATDRQMPTSNNSRGPMGNITAVKTYTSKVANESKSVAGNIQVNVIQPSPDHKINRKVETKKKDTQLECRDCVKVANAAKVPMNQLGENHKEITIPGETLREDGGDANTGKCISKDLSLYI